MISVVVLGAFAVLFATAVPALLRRLPLDRAPRVGTVLWQVTLAAATASALLAALALAVLLPELSRDLAESFRLCLLALQHAYRSPGGLAGAALGLALFVAMSIRLLWSLAHSLHEARRQRVRHRALLALVARPHVGATVVVDSPVAIAYCVPGRPGHVVVTEGALARLTPDELDAVVAHERAHLRGRHALVLAGIDALCAAAPRISGFRDARQEVGRLLEMLADDAARREHGGLPVAHALLRLGTARAPAGALPANGGDTMARVLRLTGQRDAAPRWLSAVGYLAALSMLVAPVLIALGPVAAADRTYCPVEGASVSAESTI
ncbi:MAG: M56 family metallopeptidase [Actinomycetota bacterium]